MLKKLLISLALVAGVGFGPLVFAEDAPAAPEATVEMAADAAATTAAVPAAEEAAPAVEATVNKGDVAWMIVATLLVVMMVLVVLWAVYGYSLAFGGEGPFIGGFDKLFMSGVTLETLADTFTPESKLPELLFAAFQATFAGLTTALIVGSYAERMKFSAVIIFSVLWFTLAYLPIAHMVWGAGGYLLGKGALDFAGGTVVHINAGIAGLVGAYMLGKRIGYGRESMAPHSLPLMMLGAAMLWVGWFGFNAGSNLEATAGAALAVINTLLATAAAVVSWSLGEGVSRGKASMLGAASGAIAGLVAITPACGTVGPIGAIVIGFIAGLICLWSVSKLKKIIGADDSLDVFGVHGVGGIAGALLTGVFSAPGLGGTGAADFDIAHQLLVQAEGVIITIVWSAVVAVIAYKVADLAVGLRVKEEEEREGLDTTYHGESAYHS